MDEKPKIYLLGEVDFNMKGKELIELGLLSKIKEYNDLLCVSFEISSEDYQESFDRILEGEVQIDDSLGDISLLIQSAMQNSLRLLASDYLDSSEYMSEEDLNNDLLRVQREKDQFTKSTTPYKELEKEEEDLLEKLRPMEDSNREIRNNHVVSTIEACLADITAKDPSVIPFISQDAVVHIGDLSQTPGLAKKFRNLGYEVEVKIVHDFSNELSIKYQESGIFHLYGDALDAHVDAIVHGVAYGRQEDMRTGIAKSIKSKWPGSYRRFKAFEQGNQFNPGDVWLDELNDPKMIYVATQPDMTKADINFVEQGLENLRSKIQEQNIYSISMPKIGCGHGKLSWEKVEPLVERSLGDLDIPVLVYELED